MHKDPDRDERIVLPDALVVRWRAFEGARRELPGIDLSFKGFCSHLDTLGYELTLPEHTGAVYLCAACARGNHSALKTLEANYFPALRRSVLRQAPHACSVDDVLQRVRERLFVGPTPRISKYRGQGGLRAWLGVIASNALRDEFRARRQERAQHALLELALRQERVLETESVEDQALACGDARQLELLLRQAVSGLTREERHFLRLRYVDGISVDEVARQQAHHRSTAARKIERGEQHLKILLQRLITAHFGALETPAIITRLATLSQQLPLRVETLLADAVA